jgi:hypothetical protein
MQSLDPTFVKQQIANLKLIHPEIWDDEDGVLLVDMLTAETGVCELLNVVEDKRQNATAMAAGIASRIAELELRLDRYERREEAMRALEFKLMQAAEVKKLELPIATLSIRNGTQKVIVTDDKLLPDVLCRIKREPDKTRIKEMLMGGQTVRGCELSNAEPTIAIRTK